MSKEEGGDASPLVGSDSRASSNCIEIFFLPCMHFIRAFCWRDFQDGCFYLCAISSTTLVGDSRVSTE